MQAQQARVSKTQQLTQQALREAHESVEVARGTTENLALQQESLDRSETTLESSSAVLNQAKRVLRGMTWTGTIQNAFTKKPQVRR